MNRAKNKEKTLKYLIQIQRLLLKNDKDIHLILDDVFQKIPKCMNINRILFYKNYTKNNVLSAKLIHQWNNNNKPLPEDHSFIYLEYSHNFYNTLLNKNIYTNTLKNFDAFEQQILLKRNVKSTISAPIFISDEFYGFIMFEDCQSDAEWSFNSINLIENITASISFYLKNKKNVNQLEETLKNREILIKETHHRIKNNLNVIQSLLEIQLSKQIESFDLTKKRDKILYKKLSDIVEDVQKRIYTMSLIYKLFYKSIAIDGMYNINFSDFLEMVIEYVNDFFYDKKTNVLIEYNFEDIHLGIDIAIPLGLVVNEILLNSIKYAFNGKDQGKITIELKQKNKKIYLSISDDGIGLPLKYRKTDDLSDVADSTLGLSLIRGLTTQINGELKIDTGDDGTKFSISMDSNEK